MRNNEMILSGLDEETIMNDSKLSNKLDMIRALETLSEGINTKQELIEKIETIFSDKKQEGISLSTVHKSKGLESKNVYIACASLMPSKTAIQDWEKEQEHNLMYVAFTRAKDKLVFLDENDFAYLLDNSNNSLKAIEHRVNFILNKSTILHIKNVNDALKIIRNAKPLDTHFTTNKTILENKNKKTNKLQAFQTKRLIKRK